jgi:hypothetical protein
MIIPLFLLIEGSHSIGESIGGALDLISGLGGTLGLEAALSRVSTPLLEDKGVGASHRIGKSISVALDLEGSIGGALHHVAALTGVTTPLGKGLRLDGGSSQHGNSNGEELHLGDSDETGRQLDWIDERETKGRHRRLCEECLVSKSNT